MCSAERRSARWMLLTLTLAIFAPALVARPQASVTAAGPSNQPSSASAEQATTLDANQVQPQANSVMIFSQGPVEGVQPSTEQTFVLEIDGKGFTSITDK